MASGFHCSLPDSTSPKHPPARRKAGRRRRQRPARVGTDRDPHTAAALCLSAALLGLPAAAQAAPSLFPSDALTVKDGRQLTGMRLALPLPDCSARPSDCDDTRLLNELDGFDLDPRIEIGFGQPIDLSRVTAETVYLQPFAGGARIPLDRLVWSPARNTLYGHPRTQLAERTTYRIVVTDAICGQAATTTFTTMSAIAGLEQMRSSSTTTAPTPPPASPPISGAWTSCAPTARGRFPSGQRRAHPPL